MKLGQVVHNTVTGETGKVIWIDPWREFIAVKLYDGRVVEMNEDDCEEATRWHITKAKLTHTGLKLVRYIKYPTAK